MPQRTFAVIAAQPRPEVLRGLAEGAAAMGGELDLDALAPGQRPEYERGGAPAGVFLCGFDLDAELRLGRPKCPVVSISPEFCDDSPAPLAPGAHVGCDRRAAGAAAAAHLLSLGNPSFAFCHSGTGRASDTLWDAFAPPILATGGRAERVIIETTSATTGERLPRERRLARLAETLDTLRKPLAVLTQNMALALDIVTVAGRRGWAVPGDIAVLSLGGDANQEAVSPVPISVVTGDLRALGVRAAGMMESLLAGAHAPETPCVAGAVKIIARESTSTYAGKNRFAGEALRLARKEFRSSELTADTVANRLGISRTGLQKIMLRETGRSLSEEIRRLRVEECCRQLSCGSLKLASIAAECGLTDAKNLCRVFRKAKGMTPAQWRRISGRQAASPRPTPAYARPLSARIPGDSRSKSR